jgi:dienelactone hydrolase
LVEQYNENNTDISDHLGFDYKLKQVGGSVAALEIFKIMRTIDWLIVNRAVDSDRIGIAGLSYGGFYTLFSAAIDTRYKVALSAGFFNNRYDYSWGDWVWFDSASHFLDANIAALVCPRALCIQVGESDPLFKADSAISVADEARSYYRQLGFNERFKFTVRKGGHEFSREDGDLNYFFNQLMS